MVSQLRTRLEQEKGRLRQIREDKARIGALLDKLRSEALVIEQAALILQAGAKATQDQLTYYVGDLVSVAIETVFPDDDWRLLLEFVQRRGTTEADLWLEDSNGNRIRPRDAEGGGLVNVAAFALRIALWSLAKPSRPVFLLDEPFHFLHSRDAHGRVANLLKDLSSRLKLQIIMITGEDESEEMVAGADKVFRIEKKKGISILI